ncbi:MAG: hypothetical protein WB566_15690 [Terriglobales bacterium]
MKPNPKWILTFAGVTLAMFVVLGFALVHAHPMNHIEYLALMVNCGGGFEAHGAWTEQQHVRQYSVCVDRNEPSEPARSAADCGGDGRCERESAQRKEEAYSDPDALHHWRL